MMKRGRPKWQMTTRRRQVLGEYEQLIANGDRVSLAELSRRCGLHSYRDARRIVRDLAKMNFYPVTRSSKGA